MESASAIPMMARVSDADDRCEMPAVGTGGGPAVRGAVVAWALPVAAALAALLLRPLGLDEPLFRAGNALPRATGEAPWSNLTLLGSGEVAACLLLPMLRRNPRLLFALVLAALALWAVTNPLKELVEARRPHVLLDDVLVVGPGMRKNAFPSGHAATAFAAAALVASSARRQLVRRGAPLLAAAVGLSRVAVGMHFPVDVLAGAALGWSAGLLGLALSARWRWGLLPGVQVAFRVALLLAAADVLLGSEPHAAAVPLRRALGAFALVGALAGLLEAVAVRRRERAAPLASPEARAGA